jgi:hypothetical protein
MPQPVYFAPDGADDVRALLERLLPAQGQLCEIVAMIEQVRGRWNVIAVSQASNRRGLHIIASGRRDGSPSSRSMSPKSRSWPCPNASEHKRSRIDG